MTNYTYEEKSNTPEFTVTNGKTKMRFEFGLLENNKISDTPFLMIHLGPMDEDLEAFGHEKIMDFVAAYNAT